MVQLLWPHPLLPPHPALQRPQGHCRGWGNKAGVQSGSGERQGDKPSRGPECPRSRKLARGQEERQKGQQRTQQAEHLLRARRHARGSHMVGSEAGVEASNGQSGVALVAPVFVPPAGSSARQPDDLEPADTLAVMSSQHITGQLHIPHKV